VVEREARQKPGEGNTTEQTGSQTRHVERVRAVRAEIEKQNVWAPEGFIQRKIHEQIRDAEHHTFWDKIRTAWDIVAYDRYEPGSYHERNAGHRVANHYDAYREAVLRLSDPQAQMLDVLTDAVGIKRQLGQNDIPIPEKLRNYEAYRNSAEYQRLKNKVRARTQER